MEYYCLDKNHASGTLNSRFIGCLNPYQLQNLKILDISGALKPTWAKFWEFEFFLSEKTRLYRYYQNKNQLVVASSSYINLTMKLLIKSFSLAQKQGTSKILHFWGKQDLTFASNRLVIF